MIIPEDTNEVDTAFVIIESGDESLMDSKKSQDQRKQFLEESRSQDVISDE